jgi:hypothetical protein
MNDYNYKLARRDSSYRHRYKGVSGMPSAKELYKKQGAPCSICGKPMSVPQRDHSHVGMFFRDFLCRKCNHLLGNACDSIDILLKAVDYLKKHETAFAFGAAEPFMSKTEHIKKLNADPIFIAARAARMKKLHANPVFAAARNISGAKQLKKLHADPVFAAVHAELSRVRLKNNHGKTEHTRWHVNRGIVSSNCIFCTSEL